MTHTPGPWRIEGTRDSDEFWVVKNEGPVCEISQTFGYPDADEANARLIAAAPDLLAALTRLHHALSDIINASDNCECGARDSGDYCKCPLGSGPYKPVELQDGSGPKSFMADCNLAYAAIAKATTGQEEEL